MFIKYIVHSVSEANYQATADVGGVPTDVLVPGLVVELITADGTMNRTIRIPPANMEEAMALYVVGSMIITTDTADVVSTVETETIHTNADDVTVETEADVPSGD